MFLAYKDLFMLRDDEVYVLLGSRMKFMYFIFHTIISHCYYVTSDLVPCSC